MSTIFCKAGCVWLKLRKVRNVAELSDSGSGYCCLLFEFDNGRTDLSVQKMPLVIWIAGLFQNYFFRAPINIPQDY